MTVPDPDDAAGGGAGGGHADRGDGVLACALADAQFHQLAYAAFGIPWRTAPGLWWVERSAAPYFMSAGTLAPGVGSGQVLRAVGDAAAVTQVRDCWARLDLAPAGFTAEVDDPWMVRPPGYRDGDVHPASTPTDGDLHLFTGFLDGRPVATALAAVHPRVVMVGAVRTHPDVRGRGIGTALSAAVVAAAPDRPAALGARPLGAGVYLRLGFEVCGQGLLWHR